MPFLEEQVKKKILIIFTGAMELGGIERSLISLLDTIDYDRCDVDVFLYAHHGALFNQINPKANVLPEVKELAYLRESFKNKIKHGCYYSAFLRARDEIKSKFVKISHDMTWAELMRKKAPKLETHYNLAIGFFLPFDFLKEKVVADVKVGWVHTDYSGEQMDYDELSKQYSGLDYIAAVSEQCKNSFVKIFPQLSPKMLVIENVLSDKFIQQQSLKKIEDFRLFENDSIKILTVGRFSYPKKMDEIPLICRLIREKNLNVVWYLIGFGGDEELIRQKIRENHMEQYVLILGRKENPYPYIRLCDIYAQPSRYEGKSVAVREAQVLHKPVIITDYVTASSQVEDGIDGIIVPMAVDKCADEIAKILTKKEKLQQLKINTMKRDYTNKNEIEKIYALIETV